MRVLEGLGQQPPKMGRGTALVLPESKMPDGQNIFGLGQTIMPRTEAVFGLGQEPSPGALAGMVTAGLIGAFLGGIIGQIAAGLGSAVVPLRVKLRNGAK